MDQVIFPDWISGSVVWIRRDLYKRLGGFYEGFWMYYEDVDICKRISLEKGKVVSLNNVTIIHNHGGSSRVNIKTASITKTEVQISRHLYISRNMEGVERTLTQIFLVVNNIISGGLMAAAGLIFFFIPGIFLRTIIFLRLMGYYAGAASRRSWISPRSVLNSMSNVKKNIIN
jgi:GT2 family glycosyltransferase